MSPFINPLEGIVLVVSNHKIEWPRRRNIIIMPKERNTQLDKKESRRSLAQERYYLFS